MAFSVLILTKNEEINLPGCLETLSGLDDVVIFDSFSTDRTLQIARDWGARVYQRTFDNYANQRNMALAVEFKYPWVLMLDADERIDNELKNEINEHLESVSDSIDIFRIRRKDFLFGKWLKRSSGYPTWFSRILRVGNVWVEREINEEFHCKGMAVNLSGHLIHYPFNKGFAFWFDRHNRYSSMEAERLMLERKENMKWAMLFSDDPVLRRKWLKQLAFRLPWRPVLVFFYLYIIRLGLLDGKVGFRFCCMRAMYEYMIDLKFLENKFTKDKAPHGRGDG